jgi:hypothetical protein
VNLGSNIVRISRDRDVRVQYREAE